MGSQFLTNSIKTPYYIVDERALIKNLEILKNLADTAGCKILLAQKAFSMFSLYPLIGKYLDGTTASGLYEARLGFSKMGKETHVFSPVFAENEINEILKICDYVVFNSFNQWRKYKKKALKANKKYGIRINPQFSTQEHTIYDPCSDFSRLGVTNANFRADFLDGISGLHFHTLCEQNSDALEATVEAVERNFGEYLHKMEWINLGGGHHITRENYDMSRCISVISRLKSKYNLEVYLEPGEAVALNAGYLVSTVLDIVENGKKIAVLDTSAACHMPDVIEMPYQPKIIGATIGSNGKFCYRLSGATCLAGDIIGDYVFEKPLTIGDKITFCDMAIYTMVKNNTFNGMKLPSIAIKRADGDIVKVKSFGYSDFKNRLS